MIYTTQVFLSVFGFFFGVMGVLTLLRQNFFFEVFEDLKISPGLRYVSGVFTLLLGMLGLAYHPLFFSWSEKIITLMFFLMVAKGLGLLFCPGFFRGSLIKKIFKNRNFVLVIGLMMILFSGVMIFFSIEG